MSGEEWKAVRDQVELIAKEVVKWQRSRDVIYSLQQRGLLSVDHADYLRDLNATKTEQVRQLVYILVSNGTGGSGDSSSSSSLSVFLEVLEEQGLGSLVRQLDPSGTHSLNVHSVDRRAFAAMRLDPHPYQSQARTENKGSEKVTDYLIPCPPKPGQDVTNNNLSSRCNDNNNAEETVTDTSATVRPHPPASPSTPTSNPSQSFPIVVVPCREFGGKQYHKNEVYRNESEPRGYVFLANYKDFLENQHETRNGSEIDFKNLSMLFSQMGYRISPHINMTKYETILALREFHNMEEHKAVDSCIVVFMSHGRDDLSFFTSDNQYLTVHEVVERFNNRDCPLLKGKPKIFIFQFCRGTGADVGVDAAPYNVANSQGLSVETDSSAFGETLVDRDPTFTDMYIVYSTVGGFVSFRHPEQGSWLVKAICEVFMKDACNTELDHLMKKVSRHVRMNFSTEGNKQACEFVQRAFDRHFYFNPQPLVSIPSLNLRTLGDALPHVPYRRRKPRSSLRPSTPEPARLRNPSAGSTCSEKCPEDFDVLDHPLWSASAIHPRVRSLSASRRRMSAPSCTPEPGMIRGRSFSALNSEGSSPDPSEAEELGAVGGWSSTEMLSPYENSRHLWGISASSMGELCGRGSTEHLSSTMMKEASPLASPQEGYPLVHSQSTLENIRSLQHSDLQGDNAMVTSAEEARMSFKRQLSVPSNNETLEKVNDVRRYLQIHDSDPNLIQPLKRIESFINKKKSENKRRKKEESSSLEY